MGTQHSLRMATRGMYPLVGALGVIITFLIGFTLYEGDRLHSVYAPLVGTAMEIKLEATNAHLEFAESRRRRWSQDTMPIWSHLDRAVGLASAMLEGDVSPEGIIVPLDHVEIRRTAAEVLEKLAEFREVTRESLYGGEADSRNFNLDLRYHRLFSEIVGQADEIKALLSEMISSELRVFKSAQAALVLVCITLLCVAAMGSYRGRQVEEALQKSQKRLRNVVEIMPVLMDAFDTEGNIVVWNKECERVTGYAAEEIVGNPHAIELLYPDPTQRELMLSGWKKRDKEFRNLECEVTCKDGSAKIIAWSDVSHKYPIPGSEAWSIGVDVTDRRRAEEEKELAHAELDQIFRTAGDSMCVIDKDFNMVRANDEFHALSGSAEKVAGRKCYEILPCSFCHTLECPAVRVLGGEERVECDVEKERPDGASVPCILTATPLRGDDSELIGIVENLKNITVRKQAERALWRSEEKFSKVFKSHAALMAISTLEGRFVDVNDVFLETLGFDRDEVIGKTSRELNIWHDISQRDAAIQIAEEKGYAGNLEVTVCTKSGELRHGLFSVDVISFQDERYLLTMMSDITERNQAEQALKESERRFRELAEMLPEPVYESDEKGVLQFANRKALEHFGYDQEELARGFNVLDMIAPENRDKASRNVQRLLAGEDVGPNEYTALRKDGSTFQVLLHSSPIMSQGEFTGIRGIITDITGAKKMEQELLKMEKLESVGVLAGGIAHDFNNILTSILGNVSLAKMDVDPQVELYETLEEAEKATVRARDLTQQLLTFSKGGEPVKEVTSVEELIRDSVSFALSGSNVKPVFVFADNLYPVEADIGQISQVMHNLAINADQAMPDGGKIEVFTENVTVRREDLLPLETGEYVSITVKDGGIGIPQQYLQKVFDPYFTTKQTGSGLGLASSYSIIKKHNGHIEIRSEVGVGTTFYIYLPATDKESPAETRATRKSYAGSGRILVMDDEDFIRDMACKVLSRLGYTVDCAEDGAGAIELYRCGLQSGQPYDLIILDLTVPGGMGGKETVRKLREIDPELKVIVSSGFSNDPVMADYTQHGFDGIVAKPYRPSELGTTVHALLATDKTPVS